jgi:hypothetical protein
VEQHPRDAGGGDPFGHWPGNLQKEADFGKMNRKQLVMLVVLLIVLGGVGILIQNSLNKGSNSGEAGGGQLLLGKDFPVNDVLHIVIQGPTNTLNIVKKNDAWRVQERGDYPANFAQISEFLVKAAGMKVVQSQDIGASQLPRMRLVPPGQGTNSGTLLDLKGKDDKSMATVLLGKKHARKMPGQSMEGFGDEGMADGRYVMAGSDKSHALLVSDPMNSIEPKPESWLNKDFFKIEKPKVISVTYPAAPTNSWKLTRDTEAAEWKLADAKKDEKLDNGKAGGVESPFVSPTFNDIVYPAAKPEDLGLDKPTVVSVETFDGFTYRVKVGKKTGEEYPITLAVSAVFPKEPEVSKDEKPEQKAQADKLWQEHQKTLDDKLKKEKFCESWTYLLPTWNVDPVLKDRKDLLEEKKDETKKDSKAPAADSKLDDLAPPDALPLPVPDKKP